MVVFLLGSSFHLRRCWLGGSAAAKEEAGTRRAAQDERAKTRRPTRDERIVAACSDDERKKKGTDMPTREDTILSVE